MLQLLLVLVLLRGETGTVTGPDTSCSPPFSNSQPPRPPPPVRRCLDRTTRRPFMPPVHQQDSHLREPLSLGLAAAVSSLCLNAGRVAATLSPPQPAPISSLSAPALLSSSVLSVRPALLAPLRCPLQTQTGRTTLLHTHTRSQSSGAFFFFVSYFLRLPRGHKEQLKQLRFYRRRPLSHRLTPAVRTPLGRSVRRTAVLLSRSRGDWNQCEADDI